MDWLNKFFDNYNRIARVYPALLAIAPIIWSVVVLFPGITSSIASSAIGAVLSACTLFLLANVARSQGKKIEPTLLAKWGGWPSTAFLRHSDKTIDRITKARYHNTLSALCNGLAMPSADIEAKAPVEADDIYRSATKKLIELRRDPKFGLVHSENAAYGFRRNLYGMRTVLIVISATCLMATLIAIWLYGNGAPHLVAIVQSGTQHPQLVACAGLDLIYFMFCLWAVGDNFVLQSAREYAHALLRTLDLPNTP